MDRPDPSWDLYRTALAVLDSGSLSGAARALGLTQPTVGRQIEALETALGVALFTRSQAGLLPTEAALALRPYAKALASTEGAMRRAVSAAAHVIEGSVRLSASQVIGAEVLPPILTALHAAHPKLQIELVLSNDVQDLLHRDADIAVRMVEPAQDALVAKRIGSVAIGLHARRDYLDRRGIPANAQELKAHSLIGFDTVTPFLRGITFGGMPLSPELFALRADSDLAQLAMVRAGFGIGVCQVPLAAQDPRLVRVLPDAVQFDLPVWVVMHENLRASGRYRAVFDALVVGLGEYLG